MYLKSNVINQMQAGTNSARMAPLRAILD